MMKKIFYAAICIALGTRLLPTSAVEIELGALQQSLTELVSAIPQGIGSSSGGGGVDKVPLKKGRPIPVMSAVAAATGELLVIWDELEERPNKNRYKEYDEEAIVGLALREIDKKNFSYSFNEWKADRASGYDKFGEDAKKEWVHFDEYLTKIMAALEKEKKGVGISSGSGAGSKPKEQSSKPEAGKINIAEKLKDAVQQLKDITGDVDIFIDAFRLEKGTSRGGIEQAILQSSLIESGVAKELGWKHDDDLMQLWVGEKGSNLPYWRFDEASKKEWKLFETEFEKALEVVRKKLQ